MAYDPQNEVMVRLTATVRDLMHNPVGLLGQRIGVASDFRTGLEERAVAACRAYAAAWKEQEHFHPHGSKGGEVLATGREILAAETPKPRWRADGTTVIDQHTRRDFPSIQVYESSVHAQAVAKALNAVEAK